MAIVHLYSVYSTCLTIRLLISVQQRTKTHTYKWSLGKCACPSLRTLRTTDLPIYSGRFNVPTVPDVCACKKGRE